jgi:hypothetical protein
MFIFKKHEKVLGMCQLRSDILYTRDRLKLNKYCQSHVTTQCNSASEEEEV